MTKKTSAIFIIFFVVAFVGIFFMYFYRIQVDKLVDKYTSQITVCGNISDEDECFDKDFCEGIYGPSCPDCNDLEFRSCQRVSLKTAALTEGEKSVCQRTGGEWYANKFGNFCLCQKSGANKIFDSRQGCIVK